MTLSNPYFTDDYDMSEEVDSPVTGRITGLVSTGFNEGINRLSLAVQYEAGRTKTTIIGHLNFSQPSFYLNCLKDDLGIEDGSELEAVLVGESVELIPQRKDGNQMIVGFRMLENALD